jgi:hypothetical protein
LRAFREHSRAVALEHTPLNVKDISCRLSSQSAPRYSFCAKFVASPLPAQRDFRGKQRYLRSEIEVARTRKNYIAKAPSEGWVQRAGGASVVEDERAMMEDDWQVTSVNNAPFWVHVRAPSIWRESGSSERRQCAAKSGEVRSCAAKDAEVMYQHLR